MWVEAWGVAFAQPEWLLCAHQAGLALPKGQMAAAEAQVAWAVVVVRHHHTGHQTLQTQKHYGTET